MPRLTADQWEQIRVEREGGASFGDLAARHGVDRGAICRRASKEGWGDGQDISAAVLRKVNERINGVDNALPPKKRAEAIESRAEVVTRVLLAHQDEWTAHRERFGATTVDFEEGKHAKINAEMLLIRQKGERLAHGLGAEQIDPTQAAPAAVELVFRGT